MSSWSTIAYAKINLELRVLGCRPDGYHEVRTVLQSVAIGDRVSCTPEPGPLEISCTDPAIPRDARNLVWKAACALWHAAGRAGEPGGVAVHLLKAVPAEAGLGGGSADAAAAVRLLQRIWGVSLDPAAIDVLLARLGADVPFLARGGTMVAGGTGTDLRELPPLPRRSVVLARPARGVATADAYRWWDADGEAGGRPAPPLPAEVADWPAFLRAAANDLEAPVVRRRPEIGRLIGLLRDAGAELAAMSGSGSAVFGLFEDDRAAGLACRQVEPHATWASVTTTLDASRAVSPLMPVAPDTGLP